MARYIKANPKVAAFLGVERDRNTVKDGNYLLWQADMLAFGPLTQLTETLAQIGGIAAVKRLVGTSQKIGVIHLFRLLSFYFSKNSSPGQGVFLRRPFLSIASMV